MTQIPAAIRSLNLPDSDGIIVMGGSAMELYGLRTAGDIDLVVSLQNWQYLQQLGWKLTRNKNGHRCLIDPSHTFDVWRWWRSEAGRGNRISFTKIRQEAIVIDDMLVPKPEYLLQIKQADGRPKDIADAKLITEYLRNNG